MRPAVLSLVIALFSTAVSADFILSAPPREDAAEAQKQYGPLASELGRVLGEKVVFQAPVSWAAYTQEMQAGRYDFVLDGPHFVAWRAAHIGHVPLVRLDGQLSYTVFAKKSGPATLADLRFKNVCTMASPNLAAVVLLSQFDAYAAPNLVAARGGVKGSLAAFEEDRCVAVTLPNYFTERLPAERLADLRTLFVSDGLPNLALTAGPRISAAHHLALVSALSGPEVRGRLGALLESLGGKRQGILVPALGSEYVGHQRLLEGVVWGW